MRPAAEWDALDGLAGADLVGHYRGSSAQVREMDYFGALASGATVPDCLGSAINGDEKRRRWLAFSGVLTLLAQNLGHKKLECAIQLNVSLSLLFHCPYQLVVCLLINLAGTS